MLCPQCRNPAKVLSHNLASDQEVIGSDLYCLCILDREKCIVSVKKKLETRSYHLLFPDACSQTSKPQFIFAKQNCWSCWYSRSKMVRYTFQVGRKHRFTTLQADEPIKPIKNEIHPEG